MKSKRVVILIGGVIVVAIVGYVLATGALKEGGLGEREGIDEDRDKRGENFDDYRTERDNIGDEIDWGESEDTVEKLFTYTEEELDEMTKRRNPYKAQAVVQQLKREIAVENKKQLQQKEQEQEDLNDTGGDSIEVEGEDKDEGVSGGEGSGNAGNGAQGGKSENGSEGIAAEEDIGIGSKPMGVKKVTPAEIKDFVTASASKHKVPESWVYAVIEQESNFTADAVNENKSSVDRGLMQINSKTAPWIAGKVGINYAEGVELGVKENIEMGTYYLSEMMKKSTDMDYVFTAYTKGPTGADNHRKQYGTYESTYSKKVKGFVGKYGGKN